MAVWHLGPHRAGVTGRYPRRVRCSQRAGAFQLWNVEPFDLASVALGGSREHGPRVANSPWLGPYWPGRFCFRHGTFWRRRRCPGNRGLVGSPHPPLAGSLKALAFSPGLSFCYPVDRRREGLSDDGLRNLDVYRTDRAACNEMHSKSDLQHSGRVSVCQEARATRLELWPSLPPCRMYGDTDDVRSGWLVEPKGMTTPRPAPGTVSSAHAPTPSPRQRFVDPCIPTRAPKPPTGPGWSTR